MAASRCRTSVESIVFGMNQRNEFPSLNFCPFFILSHHCSLPTPENFLRTKVHTIFISNISAIKRKNPFWFSSNISQTSIKTLATVATSLKISFSKELKKKKIKRQMQMVAEIRQNRTAGKYRFFRKSSVSQIEKCKTNES
jgi:hypothetical protein